MMLRKRFLFLYSSVFYSQNIPPVSVSGESKSFSGVTTNITLSASDQNGDNLTYTLVSASTSGTATITDGVLTYTSNSGFTGYDTITFKVNDDLNYEYLQG